MRILVCSTGFVPAESFGGLPFSTYHLCSGLRQAGAEVTVVTTNINGASRLDVPCDCWTSYEGIPVWYASTPGGPFLYGRSAGRAIDEAMSRADCVINSGTLWSHSGLLSWRAAKRRRIPSLTYVRGLLEPTARRQKPVRKMAYWHLVARRILRDSNVVVALNANERETIRRWKVGSRIEIIPNGAALEGAAEGRAVLEAEYPPLAGRPYVLFLGRIHPVKGIDILLHAAALLRAERPDLAFLVVGPHDPAFAGRWRQLIGRYDLERTVIAPGAVTGVLKTTLLAHADLFVLPSYGEGLPVAALEALLAGCPVVITRQCNLPEIESANAGLLIEPDVHQLAGAIRTVLSDPALRGQMALNARALAVKTFDRDAIGERTLRLCRELANSSPTAARSL